MQKTEAIKMGREWLMHAPPFDPNATYYGCFGMTGAAGFVCRECCFRITGRGCNLKAIASSPIWEQNDYVCSLCKPHSRNDTENPGRHSFLWEDKAATQPTLNIQ